MTKLAANGTRTPIGAPNDLSEEDRVTHRKWARALSMVYSAVIIALVAVGFVTHHYQDTQTARKSQTVGFNALTFDARNDPRHPDG
jgi:hypothetical protein